jgi:broad specificity phosphatase PhoE
VLVRHASTGATRAAAFPRDEPLDDADAAGLATLAAALPRRCEAIASPALRCRQTAAAAGLDPRIEPAIAECDFGRWAGRTLADVHASEPEAVGAWMTAPDACPHGGETLAAFAARVGGWLDAQALLEGAAVAITHGGVVKAALVRALGAPLDAFWRIDAAPLGLTELQAHDGRWTVTRVNAAPSPRGAASGGAPTGTASAGAASADVAPASAASAAAAPAGVAPASAAPVAEART